MLGHSAALSLAYNLKSDKSSQLKEERGKKIKPKHMKMHAMKVHTSTVTEVKRKVYN